MAEIVEDYARPLPDLVAPYATEKLHDELPYSYTHRGQNAPPIEVVYDLSDFVNDSRLQLHGEPVEEVVINYFVARATKGEALKVATSIIKYDQTGELVMSLENVQKTNLMPFNMNEEFQRKWLKSCADGDLAVLGERLRSWKDEQSATPEEIEPLQKQVDSLQSFIPKIDERKPGAAQPGQLK